MSTIAALIALFHTTRWAKAHPVYSLRSRLGFFIGDVAAAAAGAANGGRYANGMSERIDHYRLNYRQPDVADELDELDEALKANERIGNVRRDSADAYGQPVAYYTLTPQGEAVANWISKLNGLRQYVRDETEIRKAFADFDFPGTYEAELANWRASADKAYQLVATFLPVEPAAAI